MKRLDILLGTLLYSLYMLLSCVVIMFAEMLIIKVIGLFVGLTPFALCVIRAIIYTLGVNAIMAIAAFREGYHAARFSLASTAISGALASLLHFVFCLLFSFEAFCAGNVKFITALILFGTRLDSPSFSGKLDRFDMIPFFFISAAGYIIMMAIFGKLGERKRLSDRKELTEQD